MVYYSNFGSTYYNECPQCGAQNREIIEEVRKRDHIHYTFLCQNCGYEWTFAHRYSPSKRDNVED
jgi:uncharacterized Zn finger protein